MRNIIYTFLLCFVSSITLTNAQITILLSDLPQVNDTFIFINDTAFAGSAGSGGANQTWDFSSLNIHTRDTFIFVDPSATPYAADYPTSNLSLLFMSMSFYGYFMTDPTGFYETGQVVDFGIGTPLKMKNNPLKTNIMTPATFGDSFYVSGTGGFPAEYYGDTLFGFLYADSIRYNIQYSRKSVVDGYGTTITPLGAFDSTLRQMTIDTEYAAFEAYVTFPFPGWMTLFEDTTIDTEYSYLGKGIGFSLADVTIDNQGNVTANYLTIPSLCGTVDFSQSNTVCQGDSITVGNNTYTTAGTYVDYLVKANGCDSIITTNLTVLSNSSFSQTVTISGAQTLTVGANTYTTSDTSGTYKDTLFNAAFDGCDSIVTTNLTVLTGINQLAVSNLQLAIAPNPFISQTTITYSLAADGMVTIELYNLLGEKVKIIAAQKQGAGKHRYSLDFENGSNVVYFLKLKADDAIAVKRIIQIR